MPDIDIIIKATDKASGPLKTVSGAIEGVGASATNASGKVSTFTVALGTMLGNLASTGISKLLQLGSSVITTGVNFDNMGEQAQIAFTTMLGDGTKAQNFLGDLQKFAAETPFEFPELLQASQRMLAMGIAAEDIKPDLTAIGDAVAGLGGGGEMIGRITTALGQMHAKGKTSSEEMMQLTEAGIPAWQFLADAIGTDVPAAMKQVTAGTVSADKAISAIIGGMNTKFGGMMTKQSHTFGGLVSTVKDTFTQMSGTVMKPFFDLMTKGLQAIVDWTSKPEFTEWVKWLADGAKSAATWIGNLVEKVAKLFSQFSPGLTLVGNLEMAMYKLFGPTIGGMINGVIDFVTDLVRVVTNLFTNVKMFEDDNPFFIWLMHVGDYIREKVVPAIGGFISVAIDLAKYIGFVVKSGDPLNDFLAHLPGWMKPAVEGIGEFIATTIALAKYIGFVVTEGDYLNDWITHLPDWMKPAVKGIGEFIAITRDLWGIIVTGEAPLGDWSSWFERLTTAVGPGLAHVLESLGLVIASVRENLIKWAQGELTLPEAFGKVWTEIKTQAGALFGDLIKYVKDKLPEWVATFQGWASAAWQWIVDVTPTVVAKLGEWASAIWKWVTDNAPEWGSKLAAFTNVAWNWLTASNGVIAKTGEKLGEWATALWKWITDKAPEWDSKLGAYATVAWNWLTVTVIPKVSEKLGEWATALWKWITDNAPTWATKLGEFANKAWDWLKNTVIPAVTTKLGEWATALWKWITDNAPTWATKLGEFATNTWKWLKDTVIPAVATKLGEWGTALWKWITDNAPTWATKLGELATRAWDWLKNDVIPKVSAKLGEWGTALYKWVTDNAPEWAKKLVAWGEAAWKWITEIAIPKAKEQIGKWWDTLRNYVETNLPAWKKQLEEWAYAAWHWVVDTAGKIPEKLAQWWAAVKLWFDTNLPKFQTTLALWGAALKQWVIDATPKTTAELGNWWLAVSKWFLEKGPSFEVSLVQWTTKLVQWVGKAIPGVITGITDLVTGLVAWMMGTAGDKGIGKINTGLESWVQAFKDWVSGPNGLITRLIPEWKKLGGAVVDAIISINQAITDAKARITDAIATALVFVGFAIVDGIKSGIDQASGGLLTKITDMANAALAAAKTALGIQSPSKQFHYIGQQVGQGFVNGIDSMLGAARGKAIEMAKIASDAAAGAAAANAANYQRLTGMAAPAGVDPATAYYNSLKTANAISFPANYTPPANTAGMVQAEDGTWVKPSFYATTAKAVTATSAASTAASIAATNAANYMALTGKTLAAGVDAATAYYNSLKTSTTSTSAASIAAANAANYQKLTGMTLAPGVDPATAFYAQKAGSTSTSKTTNFTVNVQSSGNAVQDIRNQVELYALTFGGA